MASAENTEPDAVYSANEPDEKREQFICNTTDNYEWFYALTWVYPPPNHILTFIYHHRTRFPMWPPHMYTVVNSGFIYNVSQRQGEDVYASTSTNEEA